MSSIRMPSIRPIYFIQPRAAVFGNQDQHSNCNHNHHDHSQVHGSDCGSNCNLNHATPETAKKSQTKTEQPSAKKSATVFELILRPVKWILDFIRTALGKKQLS